MGLVFWEMDQNLRYIHNHLRYVDLLKRAGCFPERIGVIWSFTAEMSSLLNIWAKLQICFSVAMCQHLLELCAPW